jgi:N-acetylneuraminate synthase/N,N'-diacetyllegionaminate synthase
MRIGDFDTANGVFTIAEIGNNHEGSYAQAEEMVGRAAEAGADAVKFQTIVPERLVAPSQTDRIRQLKKLCLTYADFEKLAGVAKACRVRFLSTPFDLASVRFLDPLVPAFKVASGDNDFLPLLDAIAATGKPVILSTGLMDLAQARARQQYLESAWRRHGRSGQLALLHCVVSYPVPDAQANLGALRELAGLGCEIGYSDHTIGIEAAVLATVLGARIVEKHFTLDKSRQTFRDHQLSADPSDFAEMVRRIRLARELVGDGHKRVLETEKASEKNSRRSIVAARRLVAGTVLASEDLTWLRPAGGLAPGNEAALVGKRLVRDVEHGEMLLETDVMKCAA